MTVDDIALRASAALNRAGVPFMLVGSFFEQLLRHPKMGGPRPQFSFGVGRFKVKVPR